MLLLPIVLQAGLYDEASKTGESSVKSQREPWFGFSDYDLHDLSNKIQKYYPLVKYLQVYQVNYPQPIEYIVPPAAIILSFANGEKGSPSYNKSVISAIERLASIKKPY
ncbi:MAG: hypothetical protein QNJ72_26110 [Pleurocapsa sp. MO_226.B13]|nr:hypothetical protein [Pleurocapsa sp. MO_226.B13]